MEALVPEQQQQLNGQGGQVHQQVPQRGRDEEDPAADAGEAAWAALKLTSRLLLPIH